MLVIYGSLIVLAFVNPIALDNIGWKYYIVFCVLLLFMLVVVYFLFPETRGHSLEEISEIFDGPNGHAQVSAEDIAIKVEGKMHGDSIEHRDRV